MQPEDDGKPCIIHGRVDCQYFACNSKAPKPAPKPKYRSHGGGMGSADLGGILGAIVEGAINAITDIWL